MIPSPKLEEVYAALQDGKYSIVNFSKSSFTEKDEALNECKEAVSMLDGEAVLIEVDMDNEKEANFLKQFRIDPNTTESPITVVLNKQGQVAGTATTVPEAGKLVTAAKTPVQGGCAGGPMGCGR